MARTVLLRHEMPGGSWHFDWLLARDGDETGVGAGPLIAFRVTEPINDASVAAFSATHLADHRPKYLTFEGDIPGDRGHVTQIAHGTVSIVRESADLIEGVVDWGEGGRWFTAQRIGEEWGVRVLATARH